MHPSKITHSVDDRLMVRVKEPTSPAVKHAYFVF